MGVISHIGGSEIPFASGIWVRLQMFAVLRHEMERGIAYCVQNLIVTRGNATGASAATSVVVVSAMFGSGLAKEDNRAWRRLVRWCIY